jgi:hypothetical protein
LLKSCLIWCYAWDFPVAMSWFCLRCESVDACQWFLVSILPCLKDL